MSDTTITPPCSPPCGAQEVEMEEGELLDETQDLPDMSDISDEEGSVREYQYDTTRYYRGGREGGADLVMLDSPASPDTRQEVTGSPIRIIPGSPLQDDGDGESLGEEEDLDEDILYLRLIALRSLAVEEKREQGELEESKLAMEMQELLEEAEVAANEEAGAAETAVISEVITIDDEEEDPISEMKLNLHESYMRFKQSVEVVDMTSSPSYSPTQSPSLSLSPAYIAPGDSPSLSSPSKYSYPLVDLTSPYSPSDDSCIPPLPPLPPLPPPSISPPPPLPPPPPSYPDPVPTTTSKSDEPLPPGEDTLPTFAPPPPGPPPSGPPVPQDMDIDSGEEAESQFFLSQQNLFPASVWDFSNQQPLQPRQRYGGKREQEREGQVKRRRKSDGSQDRVRKSSKHETEEPEEDEESLRLLLLAQVSRGKGKPKDDKLETETVDGIKETEINSGKDLTLVAEKCVEVKENIEPKVAPVRKAVKPVMKAKAASKVSEKKSSSPFKPKSASRIVSRTSSTSSSPARRELPNRNKAKHKQIKISKADQRRFFPNLSKTVVVPLAEEDSDSDDNDAEEVPKQPPKPTSNMFGLDLEAFLKQARNSAKTNTQPTKPKVVKKKIALTPQLKAKALELTLADKKKLITAQISHLSRSKQMEYKRLKEILAKRENEKVSKEKKKKKQAQEKPKANESMNVRKSEDTLTKSTNDITDKIVDDNEEKPDDDEATLRLQLLQNMKTSLEKRKDALESQKKADSSCQVIGKSGSPKKGNIEISKRDNITVMLSGETRNVEVNGERVDEVEKSLGGKVEEKSNKLRLKEGVEPEKQKLLKEVEAGVVSMRKTLSTSLFKLSAYMSQLQKETIGVESGIKYAEELRRQLRETEELVMLRQEKVDNLREVIRDSHKQITMQRQDMTSREEECRTVGLEVFDGEYKPPAEGAENIRRKLEMIRNTALKVKTTVYATPDPGQASTGSIVGGSDYRSPLEHLNQSHRLDTVKLDHTKELCRFELAGKCLDEACQFQHCL